MVLAFLSLHWLLLPPTKKRIIGGGRGVTPRGGGLATLMAIVACGALVYMCLRTSILHMCPRNTANVVRLRVSGLPGLLLLLPLLLLPPTIGGASCTPDLSRCGVHLAYSALRQSMRGGGNGGGSRSGGGGGQGASHAAARDIGGGRALGLARAILWQGPEQERENAQASTRFPTGTKISNFRY